MTCTVNHLLIERGERLREEGREIMKKTNKTMHMGVTIQFIEDTALQSGEGVGYFFDNFNDKEAQAYLDSLKAIGFTFAPTCDSIGDKGQCAGH